MLRNYFTVIFRSLLKNKLFSFIHIFGLAMGLACAFIIFLIIRFEHGYDQFHEHKERIYILRKTIFFETGTLTTERTGDAYGPQMASVYPDIEKASRFKSPGELLFNVKTPNGKTLSFIEVGGAAVDSAFLEIFTFPMIYGNPHTALANKNSIILTESLADKLFSSTDVIGKEIRINDTYNFIVNGIIEDVPLQSFFQFDFLIPYDFLRDLGYELHYFEGTRTYNTFLLHEGADPGKINEVLDIQKEDWFEPDIETIAEIFPFAKIHVYGESQNNKASLIFLSIAILILVIAAINYTNLSTARFASRSREVGIRKTVGADRSKLFWQFIGESIFNSFLAMDVALLITEGLLPFINNHYEINLAIEFGKTNTWLAIIFLILFTGFLSGTYPSLVMSKFLPVNVLKNPFLQGFRGFRLRKILVSVQFSFAVAFIIIAFFLVRQVNHLKSANPGIKKENIIYFQTKGLMWDNYENFKNKLLSVPGITEISSASSIPFHIELGEFEWGLTDEHQDAIAMVCWADESFPELFNIAMTQGTFYQKTGSKCENSIIINKRMQEYLDLENPVGESFYLYHHRYQIIGVIDDFDFFPLKLVDQLLIMPYSNVHDYIFIGHTPGHNQEIISEIESIYKEWNPAYPFEYDFLENYAVSLESAFNESKPILWFFTFLSIFISLLGLFGLTAFTSAQKVKEIGIRKTFGASVFQIIARFSFQFARPVIISVLAGIMISYTVLYFLLNNFSNPTPLHWLIFVLTGLGVFLLSQLTVIGHAIRSSRQQPVDCLRYE